MTIEQHLFALCEPALDKAGYELVMVQVSGSGSRRKAVLFIDKEGGVSVEDCAVVSKLVDPLIEENSLFEKSWVLEVSSPGLNRPLFKISDYERFSGRKAKIHLRQTVDNRRKITGILKGLQGGTTVLIESEEGQRYAIELDNIHRANLIYEWN